MYLLCTSFAYLTPVELEHLCFSQQVELGVVHEETSRRVKFLGVVHISYITNSATHHK